jgi:dATP pyrophosphohydrolase
VYKNPESVLVVVHTPDLQVLLLERARHVDYWQSVTGSLESGESPEETALRELREETGLSPNGRALRAWKTCNRFEILPLWRDRYAPGVTTNLEHVFSVCIPAPVEVALAPGEHRAQCWLDWKAAAGRCFSWTNQDAIRMLPHLDNDIPR